MNFVHTIYYTLFLLSISQNNKIVSLDLLLSLYRFARSQHQNEKERRSPGRSRRCLRQERGGGRISWAGRCEERWWDCPSQPNQHGGFELRGRYIFFQEDSQENDLLFETWRCSTDEKSVWSIFMISPYSLFKKICFAVFEIKINLKSKIIFVLMIK